MLDELLARVVQSPKWGIAVGGVLVVMLGGFVWWHFIWENPQTTFEDMLARNLQTMSVTKHVAAGKGDQSVDQLIRLQLGSTNAADWLVTAKQSGSMVTTESIVTPVTGYLRYNKIVSTQKGPQGQSFDFSGVTNIWAKSDGQTDTSLNTLFGQTLLDITSAPVPPIGNLTDEQRDKLVRYMIQEKVFQPDYSKVRYETANKRAAIAYPVAVRLGGYVRMMQAFAKYMHLKGLDQVDPAQYDGLNPVTMTVWVNPASHQMVQLTFPGSGFTEGYSDWGLLPAIQIPTKTITTTELQQKLQALGS